MTVPQLGAGDNSADTIQHSLEQPVEGERFSSDNCITILMGALTLSRRPLPSRSA